MESAPDAEGTQTGDAPPAGAGGPSSEDAPAVNRSAPSPSGLPSLMNAEERERRRLEEREYDKSLVQRAQQGDRSAFRELYERYHRRSYSIAYGVVKNEQDAREIVQEAFIRVHKHIARFEGSSSFYTWLYRIVMNLSIDHLRRKKGRSFDYDDRIGRDDDLAGDGAIVPSIMDANPRKTVVRKELRQALQKALDELPEIHRAVILLREVEGMSYEEMARVLEVPKGTIMSRLFHARRKMQESLQDFIQGDLKID